MPVIGIPACIKYINQLPFHSVGDKYLKAIINGTHARPFIIPALGECHNFKDLIRNLDGLMLTGSASNVNAKLYNGPQDRPDSPQDPDRDATTIPLIQCALDSGLPILCICRGIQELNVALGGSLFQQIHLNSNKMDHRENPDLSYDERYAPKHMVKLTENGLLHRLIGKDEIKVNSLHWQGIDRLADRLSIEAIAPDGIIEAVRVKDAHNFALGVQWHPEYDVMTNFISKAIFEAFGQAVADYAQNKNR
ncbi:MAG: gamma-glutamyl-gamma-aminobutyrate hydrolase family protein [Alphaproteobacteria bacterium]|nr:gamma-glutamyl-gamma-aminobutyrate hydrolase family protein [Alphaproteobacteria bacterium]